MINIKRKSIPLSPEARKVFDQTFREYTENPIDVFNNNKGKEEAKEIEELKLTYERTIRDIVSYYAGKNSSGIRILEIGPWVGVASTTLKRLGFDCHVQEIPEFLECTNLKKHFLKENIPFHAVNLKHYKLPWDNQYFDMVIMCEVLEHLNFNPLPVLTEINRVLKTGGMFYLSLPNLSVLHKRMQFLFGQSIYPEISKFSTQLTSRSSGIIGIHWREYTVVEIKELLAFSEFKIIYQYLFHHGPYKNLLFSLLLAIPYRIFPTLLPNQTTMAKKTKEVSHKFHVSEVITP